MRAANKPAPLAIAGAQIQGRRQRQEDAFAVERFGPREALVVAADGLGGHPAGDVASREGLGEFVRCFQRCRETADPPSPPHWLEASVHAAQRHLLRQQRRHAEHIGMATTLVALYVKGRLLWAASVGDSYLLRLRGGTLVQLNELHAAGGGVTSAIGFNLTQIDVSAATEVHAGDRYLLATDGLVTLDHREVTRLLAGAGSPDAAVRALLEAVEAHDHPYQDNVTLVALFV